MFNSIILDKSAFESLNIDEIFFLHQYYFPIVSHILIIETLADLKKDDNRDQKERVHQLAHKILQLKPRYTVNYQILIEGELFGEKVYMSRRPIVGQGKEVISDDGKLGYVFDQPTEEKILQRWQLKDFSKADELSAESWRLSIEENIINLEEVERLDNIKELKNLNDIILFVNQYMTLPESQKTILENILTLYKIDITVASNVFYKYESKQFSFVHEFAPYTSFCFKIFLAFSLSLSRGIITPRKTDIIDLQYLYYLPFASIFVSNDKFHRMFAPLFLEDDQIFMLGTDLKADLKNIVNLRNAQDVGKQERWVFDHRNYPPEIESSFTSELWKKHVPYNYRRSQNSSENKSPEENKEIIEKVNKLINSPANKEYSGSFKDEETGFIVTKRKVGPTDFCPCGSGKLFKDCHMPEVIKEKKS